MYLIFVAVRRQQVNSMQSGWDAMEAQVAAAREAAAEAAAATSKVEADLGALSESYNSLEQHSYSLEEQLTAARQQMAEAQAATAAAQQAAAEARSALEAQAAAMSQAAAAASGGISEAEVQQRIQDALEQVSWDQGLLFLIRAHTFPLYCPSCGRAAAMTPVTLGGSLQCATFDSCSSLIAFLKGGSC